MLSVSLNLILATPPKIMNLLPAPLHWYRSKLRSLEHLCFTMVFSWQTTKKRWYVAPICTKHEQSWLQHVGKNLVIQTHLSLKLSKWNNQQTMEPQQKIDSMGAPVGAAGMLSKRNIPSFLLSLAKGRSPCKTITWALDSVPIFMNRWSIQNCHLFPCELKMFQTSYRIKKCGIINNLLLLSSEPS